MALPLSMTLARLARARAIAPRPTAAIVPSSMPSIPMSALMATRRTVPAQPSASAAPAPVVVPAPATPAPAPAPAPAAPAAPRWQDAVYAPTWVPPAQRSSNPLVAVPHAVWSGLRDPRLVGLDRSVAARSIPQTSPYDVKMFSPKTWLNNIPRLVREDIPGLFRGSEARLLDRSRNALSLVARRTPLLAIQAEAARGLYENAGPAARGAYGFATAPASPESLAVREALYNKPVLIPKALGSLLYAGGEIVTGQESKGSPLHSTLRDVLKRTLGVGLRQLAPAKEPPQSPPQAHGSLPRSARSAAGLMQISSVPGAARAAAMALARRLGAPMHAAVGDWANSTADRLGAPNTLDEVGKSVPRRLLHHTMDDPWGAVEDARGKTMGGSALRDALTVSPQAAKLYAAEVKKQRPDMEGKLKDRGLAAAEGAWDQTKTKIGPAAEKWLGEKLEQVKARFAAGRKPPAASDSEWADRTKTRWEAFDAEQAAKARANTSPETPEDRALAAKEQERRKRWAEEDRVLAEKDRVRAKKTQRPEAPSDDDVALALEEALRRQPRPRRT